MCAHMKVRMRLWNQICTLLKVLKSFALDDSKIYDNFEYKVSTEGSITITKYKGNDKEVSVPETIEGKSVEYIGANAFSNKSTVTTVLLPNSIHNVKPSAFEGCKNLNGINIPNSTVYIGEKAFKDCISLSSINIGENVESIGEEAFENCRNLLNVNIPSSVYIIEENAFEGTAIIDNQTDDLKFIDNWIIKCDSFNNEISIPDGIIGISDKAFSKLNNLETVVLPDSLQSLGERAFEDCHKLCSVSIPDNVKRVGSNAFENTKIIFNQPDEIKTVDKWVVGHQGLMKSPVVIPANCTKVAESAFVYCHSESITFSNGLEYIGSGAFEHMDNILNIDIPENVKTIDQYAFHSCKNLQEVIIRKGVNKIGRHAFDDCKNLKKITIPSTVTEIGKLAFGFNSSDPIDLTLYCVKGSQAEQYAKDNKINYKLIEEEIEKSSKEETIYSISDESSSTVIENNKSKENNNEYNLPIISTMAGLGIGAIISIIIVIIKKR